MIIKIMTMMILMIITIIAVIIAIMIMMIKIILIAAVVIIINSPSELGDFSPGSTTVTIHNLWMQRVKHNTNLMAFKRDLRNVNWNSINNSPEANGNTKHFLKYSLNYTKNTFP